MDQAIERNSNSVAISIWCIAAVVIIGVILRIIQLAGGQFIPITFVRITSDMIWQIPMIPRTVDIIFAGIIWASLLALIKNQEDEELGSWTSMVVLLGFITVLWSGLGYYSGLVLWGIIEGALVVAGILTLACIGKTIFHKNYSGVKTYMFLSIGYIIGVCFIYALVYGVIFGVLTMIVTAITSVLILAFVKTVLGGFAAVDRSSEENGGKKYEKACLKE